jgi:hypothetical protein
MTFFGPDFEKRAIWQGFVEKPAAKDFVVRKVRTINLTKCQEPAGMQSGAKSACEGVWQLSFRQATINLIREVGNPFTIPVPGCTELT